MLYDDETDAPSHGRGGSVIDEYDLSEMLANLGLWIVFALLLVVYFFVMFQGDED